MKAVHRSIRFSQFPRDSYDHRSYVAEGIRQQLVDIINPQIKNTVWNGCRRILMARVRRPIMFPVYNQITGRDVM